MDCSQILPGAVNPGPCSLATGYFLNSPFIVSLRSRAWTSLGTGYIYARGLMCSRTRSSHMTIHVIAIHNLVP